MTDRIAKIKNRMFNDFQQKKEWWGDDHSILTDEHIKELPIIARKAMAIDYVLQNMPGEIKDDELIVGCANMAGTELGRSFPEYATKEELAEAAKKGVGVNSVWGHHPVNYEKMLKLGLCGYREWIYRKLGEELDKGGNKDQSKVDVYRAMLISLEALRKFAARYAKMAVEMATAEPDAVRRAELMEISRILAKVPENPPETLHEALQCHWLIYAGMHSCLEFIPAGRSDQYFYPFYRHDIENGRITDEQAQNMIASWLAKFSDRIQTNLDNWDSHASASDFAQGGVAIDLKGGAAQYFDTTASDNFGIAANSWLMNLILGGQDRDGNDATNELTYMILKIWNELELVSPVMSVRFFKGSPQKLYDECAKILRCGSGEPALYNDEPIIQGLVDIGIPIEDARDYTNDGCWEVLIPGKTDHSFAFVESLLMLEHLLHRGVSLMRGVKENEDYGDPSQYENFEELYKAYMRVLLKEIDRVMDNRKDTYGVQSTIAPDPMLSIFMDDCIEKGRDIANGGARYIMYPPVINGIANTTDSLVAIKKLVFEDKLFTLPELIEAMKNNFEGKETMRQQLIAWAPKFGNDDDYADEVAIRILQDVAAHMKERQAKYPWIMTPPALGTFEHYARFGLRCGASADGRLARETLSNNYSPSVGRDTSGPTAAVLSCVKADLLPFVSGCPLDIQINSNEVSGEAGLERLTGLMRSFMDLGGLIFTITGVSEDILRDAQAHPENHKGLRVRLGGFSGYFVALPPMHQEIMINRTKHGI